MDVRIKRFVNITKTTFGLDNYDLHRYNLNRKLTIKNETIYTLSMEWFPRCVRFPVSEELNPDGTAVIELNIHTGKFESVIFVGGKSYANGVPFADQNIKDVVKWVEQKTGLVYEKHFQLRKDDAGKAQFSSCIDGIPTSPIGLIDIKYNQTGQLTFFSIHGPFPTKEIAHKSTYTLSLEKIQSLIKKQIKFIEFPAADEEKLLPVFGMEEVYITNDTLSVIPFELFVEERPYVKIEEIIVWETPIHQSFVGKEIEWTEHVSVEQAFSNEPALDSYSISKTEQEKCLHAVKRFLRQEYPKDSSKWKLTTFHRDNEYIHATLRVCKQTNRVIKRKLTVILEAKSLQVINYIDNQSFLEMFEQWKVAEERTIMKEEAYEKLKPFFELKPNYVYDADKKDYILCGKLACSYGVNADNGELLTLDDL